MPTWKLYQMLDLGNFMRNENALFQYLIQHCPCGHLAAEAIIFGSFLLTARGP
eukprot:c32019_g1_i1 orf=29-187(-)